MEVTLTLFGGQQTRHRKCLIADKSEENITAYSLAVEIKISLWKRGNYRVAVEKLASPNAQHQKSHSLKNRQRWNSFIFWSSFSWVFINIAFEYSLFIQRRSNGIETRFRHFYSSWLIDENSWKWRPKYEWISSLTIFEIRNEILFKYCKLQKSSRK